MVNLDDIFFKDGIHLTWSANEKIVEQIFDSIQGLPISWFSSSQILPDISDLDHFPKKRPAPNLELSRKMPKLSKVEKWKTQSRDVSESA